jgi:hypothetical protein
MALADGIDLRQLMGRQSRSSAVKRGRRVGAANMDPIASARTRSVGRPTRDAPEQAFWLAKRDCRGSGGKQPRIGVALIARLAASVRQR